MKQYDMKAIRIVHPDASIISYSPKNQAYTLYDKDEKKIDIDEDKVKVEDDKIKTEWTAQEYARNRQADYPDWGTQLNKIYDDGITKWNSEMVDPVKTKWPKDNSGPK